MAHILIVEDEPIIRSALKRLLERNHHQVTEHGSVDEAVEAQALGHCDMIISDLRLPGRPGTDLIELAPIKPVLIMTSYASLRSAVDAMRMGAVDYIAKPFDHDEMLTTVNNILTSHLVSNDDTDVDEKRSLKSKGHDDYPSKLIGSCPSIVLINNKLERLASTDSTVLLMGQKGTGKKLLAKILHQNSSRKKAHVMSYNCMATLPSSMEKDIFGHDDVITSPHGQLGLVEASEGGTLFLEGIEALTLEAQAKLLCLLQSGESTRVGAWQPRKANIRLIVSAQIDLKTQVDLGQFNEELYDLLHVIALSLPPLKDRGSDILELADYFLQVRAKVLQKSELTLLPETRTYLMQHKWSGNVRELKGAIERASIMTDNSYISPEHLGVEFSDTAVQTQNLSHTNDGVTLEDYFHQFVLENEHHMTETQLAKKLGISRKSLWERRQRLGIPKRRTAND